MELKIASPLELNAADPKPVKRYKLQVPTPANAKFEFPPVGGFTMDHFTTFQIVGVFTEEALLKMKASIPKLFDILRAYNPELDGLFIEVPHTGQIGKIIGGH
jgi:hypothetical protein